LASVPPKQPSSHCSTFTVNIAANFSVNIAANFTVNFTVNIAVDQFLGPQ